MEDEGLLLALEHRHPGQVARHQVGGELHARERQPEAARERLRQRGLAYARHVLDQQMAACQQADHAIRDL